MTRWCDLSRRESAADLLARPQSDRAHVRGEAGEARRRRGRARLRQRHVGDLVVGADLRRARATASSRSSIVYPGRLPLLRDAAEAHAASRSTMSTARDQAAVEATLPGAQLFYMESPTSWMFEAHDLAALAALAKRAWHPHHHRQQLGHPGLPEPDRARRRPRRPLRLQISRRPLRRRGRRRRRLERADRPLRAREPIPISAASCRRSMPGCLLRGLRTLPVRMREHQPPALDIARRLQAHPTVDAGLPSRPRQPLPAGAQRHVGPVLVRVPRRASTSAPSADALTPVQARRELGRPREPDRARRSRAAAEGPAQFRDRVRRQPRSVRLHIGLEGTEALWSDLEAAIDAAPTKRQEATRQEGNANEEASYRRIASALLSDAALADTTLKLVEVITSPERTETLKSIVGQVRGGQSRAPRSRSSRCPGARRSRNSPPWCRPARLPDVVEMPDTWLALYAKNGSLENLEPYLENGSTPAGLNDRALEFGRDVDNTAYMLPYGFYLRAMFYNKKLFEEAGVAEPPKTLDEFRAAAEKVSKLPGKYGYCLRGGPGGLNGWVMFGATMAGSTTLLQRRRHLDLHRSGWVEGSPGSRPLQGRPGAEGQRQLGLQRDRRRLLFRHLRDARPGPRRADRHRRAHEARGLRRHDHAEGPGRQDLPDHRLCRLGDVRRQREQGPGLEADRHARRPGRQRRLEQAHRRAADLQGGRERPVLCRASSSRAGSRNSADTNVQPTVMPTYLEEFAFFKDSLVSRPARKPCSATARRRSSPRNGPTT